MGISVGSITGSQAEVLRIRPAIINAVTVFRPIEQLLLDIIMGFSGAKAFRGQKLYSRFLMQLCHFDMGLLFFIFQRGTRFGKPPGTDQVLHDGINDIHVLLFVAEFPAAGSCPSFYVACGVLLTFR